MKNNETTVVLTQVEPSPMKQATDFRLIQGFIQTFAVAPTHVPKMLTEQVCIFGSRLYIYDTKGNTWRYATLT